MNDSAIRKLLQSLVGGAISLDDAVAAVAARDAEDLGFATIDHQRTARCGIPEVVYCAGKSADQTAQIFASLMKRGENVLATRASPEHFAAVRGVAPSAAYDASARCITLRQRPEKKSHGTITICAAGTSDLPVAEEARITAELFDQRVVTCYDVGVAGLHRLMRHRDTLEQARVIIVVAGMEGALLSVVAGLVACPVIGVPTSVGYGASFGGISALLTMLNSCASGSAVVNIDNGFGAACMAAKINTVFAPEESHS